MIRMVYDEADADPDLMGKIDVDGDGEITIDEFATLIGRQPQILQPAFDMQRALRSKCFGIKFWENATEKRKDYFANYDGLANSSWESIQKILLIRQKEREEQAKREQEEFVAEGHERMNDHKQKKTKQFTEQQMRRKKTLERIRSKELPEEREERNTWERLKECRSNLEAQTDFQGLDWLIDQRQIMWDLIDKVRCNNSCTLAPALALALATPLGRLTTWRPTTTLTPPIPLPRLLAQLREMREVTTNAQEARDVALAEGPDGEAKAEA